MNTSNEKMPEHIQKQMMECMIKDWQEQGRISLEIFDSWGKAGHPNAKQVNEMIW